VAQWAKDVRSGRGGPCGQSGQLKSTGSTTSTVSTYPEIAANGVLALIAVACTLLSRQMATQEKAFVEEGGFTERLYRVRTERRSRANP
jgi:four helix bundle suffix protein